MTLVVTGAAGWFGQAFLARLAGRGAEGVRVVVRSPHDVPLVGSALPSARISVADTTDADALREVFEGLGECQVVHAAGVIHPGRVGEFHQVNVVGTRNVLRSALGAGLTRFVHLSSNSAIGTNPSPDDLFRDNEPFDPYLGYGASKMDAELLVKDTLVDAGVAGVILRPPWFYGRFQPDRQARFLKTVRRGRFPLVGDGSNRRSMVDVDSLAAAADLALAVEVADVPAYWIADRRPYRMTEIIEAVWQAASAEGLTVREKVLRLPAAAGKAAYRIDAALQGSGRYQQEIHVAGELDKNIACSVEGAERDLGFRPSESLVDGMRRSYRYGLENGQDV
ncbi:MAG: NAD(P)-dependent oxidoreductase [Candidatus Nanopelagicales bacterium]